jgi:hypothetical protein
LRDEAALDRLAQPADLGLTRAPDLTSELGLLRLCANKKDVCAFGMIA